MSTTALEMSLKLAQGKANGEQINSSTQFHNPVNATINQTPVHAAVKPPTTENKEKTFHEKEIDRMIADPTNQQYKAAVILGKKRADAFLAAATTLGHPRHEAAFQQFRDDFNLDSALLDKTCIAEAAREIGASIYEKQDPNYVHNLKAKYKNVMKSPVMDQMFALFCEALDAKHAKVGYSGDRAWVAMNAAKYRLKPNDHLSQHQQFQPKD